MRVPRVRGKSERATPSYVVAAPGAKRSDRFPGSPSPVPTPELPLKLVNHVDRSRTMFQQFASRGRSSSDEEEAGDLDGGERGGTWLPIKT